MKYTTFLLVCSSLILGCSQNDSHSGNNAKAPMESISGKPNNPDSLKVDFLINHTWIELETAFEDPCNEAQRITMNESSITYANAMEKQACAITGIRHIGPLKIVVSLENACKDFFGTFTAKQDEDNKDIVYWSTENYISLKTSRQELMCAMSPTNSQYNSRPIGSSLRGEYHGELDGVGLTLKIYKDSITYEAVGERYYEKLYLSGTESPNSVTFLYDSSLSYNSAYVTTESIFRSVKNEDGLSMTMLRYDDQPTVEFVKQ